MDTHSSAVPNPFSPVVQSQDTVSEADNLLLEVKGRDIVDSQCIVSERHDDLVDVCHDNHVCDPCEP